VWPALGQHFYLDMSSAEIDALNVPAWKKPILHAMAEYGMFVGDTGSDYLAGRSSSSRARATRASASPTRG
jgi:hypothetical protein